MAKHQKRTTDIDVKVGKNMCAFRTRAGFTRNQLADQVGVTHQQLQKYEKGINRITLTRALDIARVLGISLEELCGDAGKDLSQSRLDIVHMRAFNLIKDEDVRHKLTNLVKSMAA